MESNENKTNYYNEYIKANQKARRLDQKAEKQQLFAQKVQQQNTTLTSQLELYKERVRVLENINKDNNYFNEFLEADERAKRYNQQAQSQFIRLGYNGPYVLSQAYAKIPKLYRAYELHDENEQLHVFDSEDTLEDAERSRLKINEFQKDKKV
ncbi:hypothetical protein Tco_1066472 [Tanacetum coccineum]|uniref:DUF4200 domain-containing protein n=1 Tax=Tanacetum coccineum TaxID=301880 RepID=A0ABQ5HA55_9ASTR